jgi:sec-independent protein translocase protein TatA
MLIIALVIIVLFGSKKLPSAARSLGQSMRILQKEVRGPQEDEPESRAGTAQAVAQAPAEITGGARPAGPADADRRAAAADP